MTSEALSPELEEIRRIADAMLIGKIPGENGVVRDKTTRRGVRSTDPPVKSYENDFQSRNNPDGVPEYNVLLSDGVMVDSTGTKQVIFDAEGEIFLMNEGPYFSDTGPRRDITDPDKRVKFLQAFVTQLHIDIPELAQVG